MRQLLYVSSSSSGGKPIDTGSIFARSRHNNARAGVTGLLYTDGVRFLQVIEGPATEIETTFQRIKADPRHRAIVVLHDKDVAEREFGEWTMAQRGPGDAADRFDDRMRRLLGDASESVRGTFMGLIAARRAA